MLNGDVGREAGPSVIKMLLDRVGEIRGVLI